jgi:hypothetical protein
LEYSFECTIGGVLRKHGFCSDREFTREELKQRPEFRSVLTDEIDGKVHTRRRRTVTNIDGAFFYFLERSSRNMGRS